MRDRCAPHRETAPRIALYASARSRKPEENAWPLARSRAVRPRGWSPWVGRGIRGRSGSSSVIAIVVIVAGIASYIVLTRPAGTTCTLSSKDPLIFDQPETPDTLDPHVTFSTPGWGIVQQIYQSLVNYNGTKYTDYLGVLAKRWTVSPSGYNYTFALRQDVHFSNGHQFNAYVMWFSLYRGIVMNQAGSFILQENFWYPGLTYYATAAQNRRAATQMAGYLNSFDFQNPVAADLAVMMAPDQSFRVVAR